MFDRSDLVHTSVRGGFAGPRMLVVGDLMLDRYLVGEVARISPEAPVPVVRLGRETASSSRARATSRSTWPASACTPTSRAGPATTRRVLSVRVLLRHRRDGW